MMLEMAAGELIQHATVFVVALGALAVVLRKVLGVFDRRPAAQKPACGTCASGAVAHRKTPH